MRARRAYVLFASSVLIAVAVLVAAPPWDTAVQGRADGPSCNLYAAPTGTDSWVKLARRERRGRGRPGSLRNPFSTPGRLLSRLAPGQTGCLRSGTYAARARLTIARAGKPGAPITLRSAPGQRARLRYLIVHLLPSARYVDLSYLDIDGSANPDVTVWLQGSEDSLIADAIHNSNAGKSCIFISSYGPDAILWDRIYRCGRYRDGDQDHAIYADETNGLTIAHSAIWNAAGFAVHLYPNAQNSYITENVIDHNRYGVIFGGDSSSASSGNVVTQNVISDSTLGYLVQYSWGEQPGHGNIVTRNCLWRGALGRIERPLRGLSASANTIADPGYINGAAHDYRLTPASRCRAMLGSAARAIGEG